MSEAVSPPPASARIILVGGGARSGKSRFALARARRLGARRVFVATGQALDGEMTERIAAHVRTRGDDFRTIEEPLALPEALLGIGGSGGRRRGDGDEDGVEDEDEDGEVADVVVVDCLTLWLSNLVCRGDSEGQIVERVDALVAALAQRRYHALVVTNEVGLGIVPETPLGRLFRDVTGRAHQRLSAIADEIHLAILGTILRLRPEPLTVAPRDLDPKESPP
jgi:adenosylcobinamide kinase/adenosylcobinamide-phosphate guanylyltransferase